MTSKKITPKSPLSLTNVVLGTPASGTLTNCTGLPISTGVSGLGTGVATFLGNNLTTTGSGSLVLGTRPTISIQDADFTIQDDGDNTKQFKFQASGITTSTTRTLTVPNFDGTIATLAGIESLTNKTLHSTNKLRNVTFQDPTITTKQLAFSLTGITSGQTRTITIPNVSSTMVVTNLAQTFSQNMSFNNGLTTYGLGVNVQNGGFSFGDRTDNSSGTAIEIDNTGSNDFSQIELTNASLVSIKGFKLGNSYLIVLMNSTGNSISILNQQSVSALASTIDTGFGSSIVVQNKGSVILSFDVNSQLLRVIGGTFYSPSILRSVIKTSGTVGTPRSMSISETGVVFTNEGVTEKSYNNLPSASAGLTLDVYCQDSDGIRFTAASGNTIRNGSSVSASAGYLESTTIGSYAKLVCINSTEWIVASSTGTWSVT